MSKFLLASIAGLLIFTGCNDSSFNTETAPVASAKVEEADLEAAKQPDTVVNVLPSAVIEESSIAAETLLKPLILLSFPL